MNLKLIGVIVAIAIAMSGYMLYTQYSQPRNEQVAINSVVKGMPTISVTPEARDLGDVSMSKGTVNTLFSLANTGTADLIIRDMEATCMCTKAAVIQNGHEGPTFGMRAHGQNPKDWSATLKPGEEVALKVYYDPTVHGEIHGAVERWVRIYSNDPAHPHVDVKIELNQVH